MSVAPRPRPRPVIAVRSLTAVAAAAVALGPGGCAGPAEMGEVELWDNPANVLSTTVRWTTTVPATSRVEFGEGDTLQYAAGDGDLVTRHEVLVVGLHPRSSYRLDAVSVTAAGEELRAAPRTVDTPDLTFVEPVTELSVLDEERMEPGWTLINLMVDEMTAPSVTLMLDARGEIVWYHDLGEDLGFGGIQASWVDGGHVLIGGTVPPGQHAVEVDLAGEVRWRGPEQPAEITDDGVMHHTLEKLASGHYVMLVYETHGGILVDVIEELDADGQVVWRWVADEHIPEAAEQHIHGNRAQIDEEAGLAYLNARDLDTLFCIDRASGDVLWRLGAGGDFAIEPADAEDPWFRYAHAPTVTPDDRVLLYDNGHWEERPASRVMEYQLDRESMTARVIWEYPGAIADDDWYTWIFGDADRLDHGNTLIDAGSLVSWDDQSRLFEVTEDGEMVWELYLSSETGGEAAAYMAQRVPLPLEVLP